MVNEKLASLVSPLKEKLKGRLVITSSMVNELAKEYKVKPEVITYLAQVIFGRKITELAQRKYGSWINRNEFLKKAYVVGMDVEIYDECKGVDVVGKIVERGEDFLVIETPEGERKKVEVRCIPEWGLVYVLSSLEKSAVVRKCKEEDKRTADDVWCVYSEKGRLLGRYKTKEEAEERLKQVEMFKHIKEKK